MRSSWKRGRPQSSMTGAIFDEKNWTEGNAREKETPEDVCRVQVLLPALRYQTCPPYHQKLDNNKEWILSPDLPSEETNPANDTWILNL